MRASYEATTIERTRALDRAMAKLLRAGRTQGDVTREHALEDQVSMVLGAFYHLVLEWTHRRNFPIAARSARMARMLSDVLAPR